MSWVVVRRRTGEAVLETFSRRVGDAINRAAYDVIPARQYLAALNRRVRAGGVR